MLVSFDATHQTRKTVFDHISKPREESQGVWNVVKHGLRCLTYSIFSTETKPKEQMKK